MNFKKIAISYNEDIRGTRDTQITLFEGLENLNKNKLYQFLIGQNKDYSNTGKPVPFDFCLKLKLRKKAKLTDFLMGALGLPYGMVISQKAFRILNLKDFNLIKFQVFPVKLYSESEMLVSDEYIYFYPIRLVDCINFNKSVKRYSPPYPIKNEKDFLRIRAIIPQYLAQIDSQYPFNNPEKYQLQQRVRRWGNPEVFYLKENVYREYDLLSFKYDIRIFVSEGLEKAVIDNNLTGIEFEKIQEQKFIYRKGGWFS